MMLSHSPASDNKSPIEELPNSTKTTNRKCWWIMVAVIGIIIGVIIIVVPVVVIKERNNEQLHQGVYGGERTSDGSQRDGANGIGQDKQTNEGNTSSDGSSNSQDNNGIINSNGYGVYKNGDGLLNGYAVSKYANLTRIQTVNANVFADKQRVFVVGDIHGCLDEFNQLIDKIQYNPSTDQLILAGDLIAKGPSNTGVIRRAKELQALCVRGNHDDKAIRFKTFERINGPVSMDKPKAFLPEGDVPDPLKYKNPHLAMSRELSDDDYDYLTSCPSILHLPSMDNSVVVHGGLDPMISDLVQQQPIDVMTMRDISENGQPTDEKKVGTPWATIWNQIQETSSAPITVYYGHDASRGLVVERFTYGLDTGCVYGKTLTAIEMKSKQIFDVPCKQYALT